MISGGEVEGSYCLKAEEITAVFPYFFAIGPDLNILRTGPMLEHLLPGTPLQDHLQLVLPEVTPTWNALSASQHQVCVLKQKQSDLLLRGQLVISGNDTLLFLVTPWLTSPDQLEKYGLQPSDLPQHDPAIQQHDMERLNRLTSELQAIFELSPDGFVSFNEFGNRSYVNPAFLHITGLTRDELENVSLQEFDRIITERSDSSKPMTETEDGTVMYFSKPKPTVVKRSIREAQDPRNNHLGVVQYFRDITHETELERMKGQFLSMAAHELRTPMASIHGFTELLLKRNFDATRQRDMLETIFRQSSRLIQMINDLLDLARIEARAGQAFDIKTQDLGAIVRSTVDALIVDKKHQVDFQLPDKLPLVAVDHDKLTQALTNVLSNAYKYSPDGGVVTIHTKHQTIRQRDYIGIAVRDQGIGMTKDQVERVFDRFFRADTSGKIPGTGLGMCLVKEIMYVHGGSVEVESEYGEGTEVTLWLPELNESQKFSEITMR